MNRQEWLKRFEQFAKRKPTSEELATALKNGLFINDNGGDDLDKSQKEKIDYLLESATRDMMVESQNIESVSGYQVSEGQIDFKSLSDIEKTTDLDDSGVSKQEWLGKFEQLTKRKPTPEEFAAALKNGIFKIERTGQNLNKRQKEEIGSYENSVIEEQVVEIQERNRLPTHQVNEGEQTVEPSVFTGQLEQASSIVEENEESTIYFTSDTDNQSNIDVVAIQKATQKATSRKWMIGVAASVLLALIGAGGLYVYNNTNQQKQEQSTAQASSSKSDAKTSSTSSSSNKSEKSSSISGDKSSSSSSTEATKSSASSKQDKTETGYKPLDLQALAAGDYSSALGEWVSTSGNRTTITEESFDPQFKWGLIKEDMFATQNVAPISAFLPANRGEVTRDDTGMVADTTKDRLVVYAVRGLIADIVYYRASEVDSDQHKTNNSANSDVESEIANRINQYRQDINASLSSRSDQLARNFTQGSKSHQEVVAWIVNESAADGIASYSTTTLSTNNITDDGEIVSCDITYRTVTTKTNGEQVTGTRTRHYIFKRVNGILLIDDYGPL